MPIAMWVSYRFPFIPSNYTRSDSNMCVGIGFRSLRSKEMQWKEIESVRHDERASSRSAIPRGCHDVITSPCDAFLN